MSNTPSLSPIDTWMSSLPQFELYQTYANTVRTRFPAFDIRSFEDARFDMAQPLHGFDASDPIDQNLIDLIVTRASHERFANDLSDYVSIHGLDRWLEQGGSVVFGTNHRQFTDDPITAETLGRIGFGNRAKTLQIVSEMICTMRLDLGEGPFNVIDKLCNISAVGHTVPRLDGNPSDALIEYRRMQNRAGRAVLETAARTPGAVTVLSVIGRHDKESKSGRTLYIHEPNRETLVAYEHPMVKVVPLCIDCPTFREGGIITPAEIHYELFDPLQITNGREDMRKILHMFRSSTQRMVGSQYKHGVKISRWKKQVAKDTALHFAQNVTTHRKNT